MSRDRAEVAMFLQGCVGLQPLVILTFLLTGGVVLTLAEIRKKTGKSADALQPALDGLCSKGFIVKQVGEHGKPSYLPGSSAFFGLLNASFFLPEQIPLLPESGATTTTLINSQSKTSEVVVIAASQIPVLPESVEANRKVCREVGIGEPKASKIATYEWVTPDFIHEHVAALGEGDKIGLAILRIENNELPPKIKTANAPVKSIWQQEMDRIQTERDAESDAQPGRCYHVSVIGLNHKGREIEKICGVELPPGQRRCSLHGGA